MVHGLLVSILHSLLAECMWVSRNQRNGHILQLFWCNHLAVPIHVWTYPVEHVLEKPVLQGILELDWVYFLLCLLNLLNHKNWPRFWVLIKFLDNYFESVPGYSRLLQNPFVHEDIRAIWILGSNGVYDNFGGDFFHDLLRSVDFLLHCGIHYSQSWLQWHWWLPIDSFNFCCTLQHIQNINWRLATTIICTAIWPDSTRI